MCMTQIRLIVLRRWKYGVLGLDQYIPLRHIKLFILCQNEP